MYDLTDKVLVDAVLRLSRFFEALCETFEARLHRFKPCKNCLVHLCLLTAEGFLLLSDGSQLFRMPGQFGRMPVNLHQHLRYYFVVVPFH